MVMCVVGLVLVAVFPENYSPAVHGDGYYYALVATFLLTSMTATAMFVATVSASCQLMLFTLMHRVVL